MKWEMLGCDWAVKILKEHIVRGKVRHAYLFSGPKGVGRRTLALRLTQALNCPQPLAPGEPCRKCRICTQVERMQHADLMVVQAEREGGILKVDQVRDLHRILALHPYEAHYRVAVLLRFEEANLNAMNALLKTLEEPALKVIIVLTAESPERLLPTVVSRCEILRLRPVTPDLVSQWLQNGWSIPPARAELLAHISGGRPGYALCLHQEPGKMEQRESWLEDHAQLLAASRVERFAYAESLSKEKEILWRILVVWLSLWRDVLFMSAGTKSPIINLDRSEEIDSLAARFGLQGAVRTTSALERTLSMLERNINARLATEVLMLDLPRSS